MALPIYYAKVISSSYGGASSRKLGPKAQSFCKESNPVVLECKALILTNSPRKSSKLVKISEWNQSHQNHKITYQHTTKLKQSTLHADSSKNQSGILIKVRLKMTLMTINGVFANYQVLRRSEEARVFVCPWEGSRVLSWDQLSCKTSRQLRPWLLKSWTCPLTSSWPTSIYLSFNSIVWLFTEQFQHLAYCMPASGFTFNLFCHNNLYTKFF